MVYEQVNSCDATMSPIRFVYAICLPKAAESLKQRDLLASCCSGNSKAQTFLTGKEDWARKYRAYILVVSVLIAAI